MIEIVPLSGIGEVEPGDDLPSLLLAALEDQRITLRSDDILAVTQKIISKSEGRFANLDEMTPGPEAIRLAAQTGKDPRLVQLVLSESSSVIRAAPGVLITRHRLGLVNANAGIDRSNIGPRDMDCVLLLPVDPDASAERIRKEIGARKDVTPAVVITDSFGRPWRMGVTAVAIGAAGLPGLVDRRGEPDRDGRTLEVTQIALADNVAAAAGLAMGEAAEGIPAALVRGCDISGDVTAARSLIRPSEQDLFR